MVDTSSPGLMPIHIFRPRPLLLLLLLLCRRRRCRRRRCCCCCCAAAAAVAAADAAAAAAAVPILAPTYIPKNADEKQSVVPGHCAPRRIADREAATAPQPHRSRSSSSSAAPAAPAVVGGIGEGGVGGGSTARLYLHNNHSSTTMRSREERPKQEW